MACLSSCVVGSMPAMRSALQLALELVEEAPVGGLGDDLGGGGLDDAGFAQAQRIEPDRVLRVELAPPVVAHFLQALQRVVVSRREAAVDHPPRCPCRIAGAEVCGLEDGA